MSITPFDPMPREDEDGTPHLSYFTDNTSFIWSGSAERPVQVCDGGAGEPVTDTIDLHDHGVFDNVMEMSIHQVLHTFKLVCDRYLRERGRA